MIGQLISNYGEIGALGAFVLLMIWYVRFQTKRQAHREDKHDSIQAEERKFYRTLVTNDMKEIHQDSLKNTELNIQGITLQKEMMNGFKEHNGHSREFSKKMVKTLDLICKKIDRRRLNKKVKVDRRK